MAENKQNTTPERRPDCVTEIRMGNTVLVVSGFFKKDTTEMCIRDRINTDMHEHIVGRLIESLLKFRFDR